MEVLTALGCVFVGFLAGSSVAALIAKNVVIGFIKQTSTGFPSFERMIRAIEVMIYVIAALSVALALYIGSIGNVGAVIGGGIAGFVLMLLAGFAQKQLLSGFGGGNRRKRGR